MSPDTRQIYEFEDFRLDLAEKSLFRGDKLIPLTPKVFETLQVLVENAGSLVEKDFLMQEIWRDRIVEESNLTFNIKMLRKALGDRANEPRFIETVPRRGYRFVANVKESCLKRHPDKRAVEKTRSHDRRNFQAVFPIHGISRSPFSLGTYWGGNSYRVMDFRGQPHRRRPNPICAICVRKNIEQWQSSACGDLAGRQKCGLSGSERRKR